jgi:hypothetical protein
MEQIDLDSVLAANPSISRDEVNRVRDMTKALRNLGLKPRGYRLTTPSERKQVRGGGNDKSDPRTVRLGGLR